MDSTNVLPEWRRSSLLQSKISEIKPNPPKAILVDAVVIHKSYIKSERSVPFTKILLGDDTGVIYAFIYLSNRFEIEMSDKMKVGQAYTIVGPQIRMHDTKYSVGDHVHGLELVIRQMPLETEASFPNLHKYIPFKFTSIRDVSDKPKGTPVDLIGIVTRIHWSEDDEEDWDWNDMGRDRPPREFELRDSRGRQGNKLRCTVWGDKISQITTEGGEVIVIKGAKVDKGFQNQNGVNVGNTSELFFIRTDEDMWMIPGEMMDFYNNLQSEETFSTTQEEERYSPTPIKRFRSNTPDDVESLVSSQDSVASAAGGREIEIIDVQHDNVQRSFTNGNQMSSIRDFVKNYEPLKVEVIFSTEDDLRNIEEKCKSNGPGVYELQNSNPRGFALIINNLHFANEQPRLTHRKGSFHDERYMKSLWSQLGYDYMAFANVSLDDFSKHIDLFKKRVEKNNVNSIVVIVMSHGSNNLIQLVDGQHINLWTDIVYKFTDDLCPSLKGKPKIFIFQACQNFTDSRTRSSLPEQRSPIMQDTLVCFPTLPGTEAARDIHWGSWFICCLTNVFMNNAHDKELIEMMHMVQDCMVENLTDHHGETRQCFWITLGFRKRLYFKPAQQTGLESLLDLESLNIC